MTIKTARITLEQAKELYQVNNDYRTTILAGFTDYELGVIKYPTKLEDIDRRWVISEDGYIRGCHPYTVGHNQLTSKERAEEVLALIQLLAFRDAVWEIDGCTYESLRDSTERTYGIYSNGAHTEWGECGVIPLVFSTEETTKWFFDTHKDLIEKAKRLL